MHSKTEPQKSHDKLPPLNALRNFETVARHGSFAAAAAELHVTHWAVGKQIKGLEDWFGVPLFERRARGVFLTDEGAALLGEVSNTFERLASAATRLRKNEISRRVLGTVRINVPPSFALYWLLPRLGTFEAQYPEIDLRISTTSRKLRYVGDAFDVGIRLGHEQGSAIVSHALMADARLPACSPQLLRQRPIQVVSDLRQHTLLHSATTRADWSQWLKEAGAKDLKPARHLELDHAYLQLAAALQGLGVALASLPLIEREIAAGRLVCPLPEPKWRAAEYALVINADRAADPAVLAFKNWISSMARQRPPASATDRGGKNPRSGKRKTS